MLVGYLLQQIQTKNKTLYPRVVTEKRRAVAAAVVRVASCVIQKNIQKENQPEKKFNSKRMLKQMSEPESVLDLPITDLNLSVRCRKAASKLNVLTIGDLTRRSVSDLLECNNFGVTSLKEMREKLAERGLTLSGDSLPQ
jgi:DNA-directed RNA polymerase alpha subunit